MSEDTKETTKKRMSDEEYETRRRELELRKLEAESQDLLERLDEREMKRDAKRQKSVNNGTVLRQIADNEKAAQDHCNHRKGGTGAEGFVGGQGEDSQYAVLKHRMPNGDVWVRCLRCAKTWKPPVEENYTFNKRGEVDPKGEFSKSAFDDAYRDYNTAVAFTTRNQMSGSVQFRFSDGGKHFRHVTKDTTLR